MAHVGDGPQSITGFADPRRRADARPQAKLVLQKMATVNATPAIAFNEAAEALCKHLAVSLVRSAVLRGEGKEGGARLMTPPNVSHCRIAYPRFFRLARVTIALMLHAPRRYHVDANRPTASPLRHARTPPNCSVTSFVDNCMTYVLLAAYGSGSAELEGSPVMKGPGWSAAYVLEQPAYLYCK